MMTKRIITSGDSGSVTSIFDRLRWECGDTYADVVLSCIMVDSADDEIAKASQRELCARIVADLEGCRA